MGVSVSRGTSLPRTSPSWTPSTPERRLGQPAGRRAAAVARQRVQVVAPGDDLGRQAGQRDVQRVRRSGPAAEVDDEAEVVVLVRTSLADPEGRRDVASAARTPWRCACWAVMGVISPGRVRSGVAATSPHANTWSWPGHLEVLVDVDPTLGRGKPSPAMSGSGRTPTHQISDRVGTTVPSLNRTQSSMASATEVCGPDLHPALAEHAVGGSGRGSRRAPAAPGARCRPEPSGPVARRAGGAACTAPRVMRAPWAVTSVPGVPGADDDEGQPRRALVGVVGVVGQLDLTGDVVTQVERLGDVAEAVGVLRDARDGQQLVDASGGQQDAVEGRARRGRPPGRRT